MDSVQQIAAAWLDRRPLFLDTETTGLGKFDQICDLAVVDQNGQVLFNTLIQPTIPIPADAYAVHGISDTDVASAPSYAEVWPDLKSVLGDRLVVIYNAAYDVRLLRQSADAHGFATWRPAGSACACAMGLYAAHWGDWSGWHGNYKWQSLEKAARQCNLKWRMPGHPALPDADMCRQVMLHLAGQK